MAVFTGQHLAATRATNFKKVRSIIKTLKASCRHQSQMYSKLDARVDPLFKRIAELEAENRTLKVSTLTLSQENQRYKSSMEGALRSMKIATGELVIEPSEDDI